MPKDHFRFKQFIILQQNCAMKVCTDACLFGAWAARSSPLKARTFLDIGTGTGLLSLMYIQKNPKVNVDAVEIDGSAAHQAKENFEASPWKEQLNIHHTSIQQFASPVTRNYDLIISNPPFFENDLKTGNEKRDLALHSTELNLEELIIAVDKFLKDNGKLFLLLPYHRTDYFERSAAKQNLFTKEKIFIKQTPKHNYFRSMLCLTKKPAATTQSEIIIMDDAGRYTKEFTELLKEYYLYL